MRLMISLPLLLAAVCGTCAQADEFDTRVAMQSGDASTYYIQARLGDVDGVSMMVDTGSGYTAINETLLERLKSRGQASFVRTLRGRLANGAELSVPLYRIDSLAIGKCALRDIEAAVFPGHTRAILGLSALRQAAPFVFSMDPPQLVLSHCTDKRNLAEAEQPDRPGGGLIDTGP